MPAGRPTKYRRTMCAVVTDLMRDGASKAEVCAELDIGYDAFLDYQEKHPEFSEAVKRGEKLSQAWWERLGRTGASGETEINPTVWIFNMKNRFKDDWRDKHDHELTGKNGGPVEQVTRVERVIVRAKDRNR